MKKITAFTLALALLLSIGVGTASAIPSLIPQDITKFKYTNFENINDADGLMEVPVWNPVTKTWSIALAVDPGGLRGISPGDSFHGILKVTAISNDAQTVTTFPNGNYPPELTGRFTGLTMTAPSTVVGNAGFFILTQTLGSDGDATPDFAMYWDDGTGVAGGWNPDITTITMAQAIARATDGVQVIDGNFMPITFTTTVTTPNPLDPTTWVVVSTLGVGDIDVLPGAFAWSDNGPGTGFWMDAFEPGVVGDLDFGTQLYTTQTLGWDYRSEDPIRGVPGIPEPASLCLMGLGLAALAGRRIRRKK